MKPGTTPLHSIRLMDQVRERIRYLHYSLSTEKTYLYWIRFFIRWQAKDGQMRHPRDMGSAEVGAFLTSIFVFLVPCWRLADCRCIVARLPLRPFGQGAKPPLPGKA